MDQRVAVIGARTARQQERDFDDPVTRPFDAHMLGQATWAVPDLPAARPLLDRLADLVEAAAGSLLVLAASGYGERDAARLDQLYAEARELEWSEFHADCGKYLAELGGRSEGSKYTLAELEEQGRRPSADVPPSCAAGTCLQEPPA